MGSHDARTAAGVYVGAQPTVRVDIGRICDVVNRMVQGLYYYENNRILSRDYDVETYTQEYIDRLEYQELEVFVSTFVPPIISAPEKSIADGVFKYKMAKSNDPDCTLWSLVFFDRIFFISLTFPKNRMLPSKRSISWTDNPGSYHVN
jgi:hypothetical protein